MLFSVLLLSMTSLMASGTPTDRVIYDLENAEELFEEFISTYNRQYANDIEKQERFQIFLKTLETINAKNSNSEDAEFGINHFADLTVEEFLSFFANLKLNSENTFNDSCNVVTDVLTKTAPESFDWRQKKVVTEVKDQARCGSCWAFSTTGSLESIYAIKYGKLVNLSEQQLVDCDERSEGCDGGMMLYAYEYLKEYGGAETDKNYPYVATNRNCTFNASLIKAKVTDCNNYKITDEDKLKELLYTNGPIAIGVDAIDFMGYKRGILKSCNGLTLNHGVVLVGYGSENGTAFWTIKNSWSKDWGEDGYIRIKRGVNACGLLDGDIVVPIVG